MESDWSVEPLGKHAQVRARIGWRGLSASEYTKDGPYLIAGQHLDSGQVNWERCDHVSESRYRESWEIALSPGDVILTKDGTIGRVARIDQLPGSATLNGTMMLVRPQQTLDYRFLYHFLGGRHFQKLVDDKVSGSSIPHIFQRDMVTLPVTLPPVPKQRRIAEILDTLDRTIRKTQQITAKLKQVKQGLLHDLLTRGIDENGELRDPERHPEQFKDSPLGLIPKEWEVSPVDRLLANIDPAMRSGPFGSALLKSEFVEEGVPLLGIDNVHIERFIPNFSRFVTPVKADQLRRYRVHPHDVMITIMGTVGRCCVVPENIGHALSSKHVWTLTFDQERYSPLLACLQFNYATWVLRRFSRDEQGGIMSAIRSDTLRSTLLPVPPMPEAKIIEEIFSTAARRIASEQEDADKLRLLKQGLMEDLLTGRVPVTPLLNESTP